MTDRFGEIWGLITAPRHEVACEEHDRWLPCKECQREKGEGEP